MSWLISNAPLIERVSPPKSFQLTEFSLGTVKAFKSVVDTAISIGQPLFPINIESYGGEVYPMLGILSIMDSARKYGVKFVTHTSSIAASCGAMVFAYGDHGCRFIGSDAKLMFHNMSSGALGKVPECLYDIQKVNKLEEDVFSKISRHLKKNKLYLSKTLEKKKNFDWELNAEEAVAEGIASEIKVPNFAISFETRYAIV